MNGDGYSDLIVGAAAYDNGETDEGRASVYYGSPQGPGTRPAWTAEIDQESAYFARVSDAGDVNGDGYGDVIVGAVGYDHGEDSEGGAFLYLGSASGLGLTAAWTAEGDQVGAYFGSSVSGAGDVNGDGYDDVIVGAYGYDDEEADEGRAFVYYGSASGLGTTAAWTAEGDQSSSYFGLSVSGAGDVNGDGYDDVIVGPFVYLGSSSGLGAAAAWTAEVDGVGVLPFGSSASGAGDVNGDGYSDVIVGASNYVNPDMGEGGAFVYLGSASGLGATAAWSAEGDQIEARFGSSVSGAGDVNGDGFDDVIVGTPYYDNVYTEKGKAFVYLGSASGLDATAAWTVEGEPVSPYFAQSVSGAGDFNGDGYSDVIVGAPYNENDQFNEGGAFIYHGSASGLGTAPAWGAEGNQEGSGFGPWVSGAGDVNGDGYSDVIVGAHNYDNGETDEGRAFVYYGSGSGSGIGLVIGPPSPGTTLTGPVTFTVTYSGATEITLAAGDVTLVRTGTADAVVSVSGTGTETRTVILSDIIGGGTLAISIAAGTATDGNEGLAPAAGPGAAVTVDNTPPALIIGAPSSAVTGAGPISFALAYSGAAAVNLTAEDITLVATGNATATVSVSDGTTAAPTVGLTQIQGDGTLAIAVGPGTATDTLGNTALGAGPSEVVTVDNTPPGVAIGPPSVDATSTGPVDFPVTYTGASVVTLEASDVLLVTTGTATGTVSVSGSGAESHTVTVSDITGQGTLAISLEFGTAFDALGHQALGAGPSPAVTVEPVGVEGDVNQDEVTNALDVQLVVNGVLGLPVEPFNTDVNGDDSTNALDVQAVINVVLGVTI